MQTFPFHDRLDVTVACLLVVQRYRALANRTVTRADIGRDVIDLIDHIDVDADALGALTDFDDSIGESLVKLVDAAWLRRREYRGVVRYHAPPMADAALEWIRSRLSASPRKLHALTALEREATDLVLERYAHTDRDARAAR